MCATSTRRRCWTRWWPPVGRRTRRRPGCWRWRCTGSTCTRPPTEHPAASFPTQRTGGLAAALGPAFFDRAPLAGAGTPAVAEHAVEELAAALNLSHAAGLSLVSEAVELRHRLPRLWALVQDGRLQAWKARQVARATTQLSRDAVAFVDRHLAVTARSNRLPALGPVLHEARLRCDPDQAAAVEQTALEHRGVWLDHRESTATTLRDRPAGHPGRARPRRHRLRPGRAAGPARRHPGPRRAPRLRARDAGAPATRPRPRDRSDGDGSARPPPRPRTAGTALNGSRGTLYLHVSLADLATDAGSSRVERLGTASLALLRDWLQRLSGVSIRPVLDPAPHRQRGRPRPAATGCARLVILRDRHCVFPGCPVDARACDLDHIQPYVPLDEGGPPGQTSPANLACLCRRHHRAKTFAGWRYRRLPDGDDGTPGPTYEWTSPRLRTYRVTTPPAR